MCVSGRLASLFLPRANTPKVNFGASTATAAPGITGGFSFGAPAATSTPSSQAAAPSGFAFGSAGTSSTSTAPSGTTGGFTFSSGSTTQAGAAGFSIGTAAPQATSAGLTFGTAPAAAATTSTATLGALESLINKWSLELEDQEKHFLHQATQVNAWDRMLIENGEKITSLHREVEKVKVDQKRLDQELDFILSQQKELEDLLTPLEESVKEQSGTIYLQHADEERERTYKLAENIDAQLKRMAQDLKDITEHLNTSRGPADTSDPLQQICKILNAHMDSLQWIDQNSAVLQRKVEEVTKVCESRRKEQERSFRITFD
uniref:Nuclear pore glycoprotein p62 n=1 Tax=Cyanoderma ruficeps TaxID=181631 RepID=A0A8C3NVU2_9PASS